MRLIATLYQWLLLLHILAAMIWVGAVAVLNVQATFLLRQSDADGVRRFTRTMRTLGPALLLPAVIALLVFGIWMVVDSDFDFEQTWVWLGIVLFAAAVVVGGVFQSRAALAAERAATAGDDEAATAQLRRWTWGMRLIAVLLVVAAWDMVFKPGL
jgi:uncharacterized membrane protein